MSPVGAGPSDQRLCVSAIDSSRMGSPDGPSTCPVISLCMGGCCHFVEPPFSSPAGSPEGTSAASRWKFPWHARPGPPGHGDGRRGPSGPRGADPGVVGSCPYPDSDLTTAGLAAMEKSWPPMVKARDWSQASSRSLTGISGPLTWLAIAELRWLSEAELFCLARMPRPVAV